MINFNEEKVIGHFVYNDGKGEWDIQIFGGNCLAVMVYLSKDENGKLSYGLFNFYADEKHIRNILKNRDIKGLCKGMSNINLNFAHKEAKVLAKYWVKEQNITIYYNE